MATNQAQGPTRSGGRRELYIIVGTFLLVLLTSTALYKAAESGLVDMPGLLGTSNNGELIKPPVAIAELRLTHADGRPFDFVQEDGSWTFLVPVPGRCDAACMQNLYLTRQVHTALGKEMDRVRRLAVTTATPSAGLTTLLAKEHPGVPLLQAPADLGDRLAGVAADRYYVVDPYGWVMMYYTPEHGGKAVLADMKFLLKYAADPGEES